tara:strand:- start:1929 stop:5861 length:3933 start_codon:yes stop_codon:yes gene_type:complete
MAREISNVNFGTIVDGQPQRHLKSEQFITLLDLVSDGAEIEGFATPSRNSIPIPTSMLRPASPNSPELTEDTERTYIELAQRDIFLQGRAVRSGNPPNDFVNIRKISLAVRTGQESQPIMSGVNELQQNVPLSGNTIVKNNNNPEGNKVTAQFNAGVDVNSTPRSVIVTLQWASLRQISFDDGSSVALGIGAGSFRGNGNVAIQIRVRSNTGAEITIGRYEINGVSIGQFSKDYRLDIPPAYFDTALARSTHYPMTVEVLREDTEFRENDAIGRHPFDGDGNNLYEEGQKRFTEFSVQSIRTTIPQIETITNFFRSAYFGLRYSAEQFPNIPQRKYLIRGIKVRIPTGVTVDVANYGRIIYPSSYTFGGITGFRNDKTSTIGNKFWTSDPAWILYALLTEDYGLNISDAKIDIASFYAASAHSSALIGGKARYSFNGVIKQRRKALQIIKEIAGLMRATLYYKSGSLKIALDVPESTVSYLFTNANVVNGVFNYSGIDKDKKYTQINVSYFNNDIQELDQVSVRNEEKITQFGLNQINIQALYTTDRDQAKRYARSILYSSHFEGEIVSFECGLEAAAVLEPFNVIKIVDKLKENIRTSGRIKSAATVSNTTTIVVDDSTNTTLGGTGDSFLIIRKDGSVQESVIQTVSGSTITVSPAVSTSSDTDPIAGTIFAIKTGNVQHRKFRITNIKQKNNAIFTITAVFYDDNKYSFIDSDDSAFDVERPPTTLLDLLPSPELQQPIEETIVVNKRAQSRIALNFAHVAGARAYQIAYSVDEGEPIVTEVRDNQFIISNNRPGFYKFSVRSINYGFITSLTPSAKNLNASGLSAPPENVVNLRFQLSGNNLILIWDKTTLIDVEFGGFVEISHSPKTDGTANYGEAQVIHTIPGASVQGIIMDYVSGEYFVKFIDVIGNKSPSATSVVVIKSIESNDLLAAQIRENTNNYQGAKTNLVYDSSIAGLRLTSGTTTDSLTDFDTLALADGTTYSNIDDVIAGVSSSGSYTFQNTIDLGNIFNFHVNTHEKKEGFITATLWDSRTDNIETWDDVDSTAVFNKTAELEFQIAKSSTTAFTSNTVTATYERGSINDFGTSITITSNNHGLLVGDHVNFTATSQNPANGLDNSSYEGRPDDDNITGALIYRTPNANTFVIRAEVGTTVTGNCTYIRNDTFQTFTNSDVTARLINFKVNVVNNSDYENVDIEELGVDLIFKPRTERSIDNSSATNGILSSSSSGATTVAFNRKFFAGTSTIGGSTDKFKPVVNLNVNNMQSGDFFTIDSVTGNQFVVSIKNGSSFVARQFTYSAFGYGTGLV